jgi:hypothetical protein
MKVLRRPRMRDPIAAPGTKILMARSPVGRIALHRVAKRQSVGRNGNRAAAVEYHDGVIRSLDSDRFTSVDRDNGAYIQYSRGLCVREANPHSIAPDTRGDNLAQRLF